MEVTIPFREFIPPHPLTVYVQKVERYLGNLARLVRTFQRVKTYPQLEEATREKFEEHIRENFDRLEEFLSQLPAVCPDHVVRGNLRQRFQTQAQQLWWQHQGLIAPTEEQLRELAEELQDLQGLVREANQLLEQQHQLVSIIETNLETAETHLEGVTGDLGEARENQSCYLKVLCVLLTLVLIIGLGVIS